MTYWALNGIFLAVVAIVVLVAARRVRGAAIGLTAAVLLVMTAVFDNVMIAVGLVDYEPSRISGVFLGLAPLEDFAYTIAAVVGLPALWSLLPGGRRSSIPVPSTGAEHPDA
ncbi:MAG: lycopene cyclase [Rhodoglobus sp.]|nr:lycopene cyclase [Rhodoglobus sp.]